MAAPAPMKVGVVRLAALVLLEDAQRRFNGLGGGWRASIAGPTPRKAGHSPIPWSRRGQAQRLPQLAITASQRI